MTKNYDESTYGSPSECRKVIKFWVERCRNLEKQIEDLKEELRKYRGH